MPEESEPEEASESAVLSTEVVVPVPLALSL